MKETLPQCLQLSCGQGPSEARYFMALLADMLALQTGATAHIDAAQRSAQLIGGADLRAWEGTHQLLAPLRGRRQRRRWFVQAKLLPLPVLHHEEPFAFRFQASRAGGPGGQHVNRTSSAVRATDLHTGHQVRVADRRSQHQNRQEAARRLIAHREAQKTEEIARIRAVQRHAHYEVERGRAGFTWRLEEDILSLEG